jgi:hypothetical protein
MDRKGAAGVEALPNFSLRGGAGPSARFLDLGLRDYHAAARHVHRLPYGRNSDRADFGLVLEEGRGTCSTKHALLAALAREHGLPVQLRLGIYEMNGRNTPGVARVLARYGLDHVPEAHCYLAYRGVRVDLTGVAATGPIEDFLYEETIEPTGIGDYKIVVHRRFVRGWAAERGLGSERAWRAREACIAALSQAEVG